MPAGLERLLRREREGRTLPEVTSGLKELGIPVALAGEGREYRAYPSLAKVRWLFPAGRRGIRRAGMEALFHPVTARGRLLKSLISAGVLPGGRVFLEEDAVGRLEEEMAHHLTEPEVRAVFYVGTPGAYRKVTAQALSEDDRVLAFARIAASPRAREEVEAEHHNLLRLEGARALRGRVPEALALFDWQGCRVLVTSAGPPRAGPRDLRREHLSFCRDLFLPFAEHRTFNESPLLSRMSEKAGRLASRLDGRLSSLLERALDRLRRDLGEVELPLSMAHRDFAPWNTRLGPQGLFVFDWDGAQEGVTPLYDAFHFCTVRSLLTGKGAPLPDRRFLSELLDGTWPGAIEHLPSLYLAYLLDVTLHYTEARVAAPQAGDSALRDRLAGRIEAFLYGGSPL